MQGLGHAFGTRFPNRWCSLSGRASQGGRAGDGAFAKVVSKSDLGGLARSYIGRLGGGGGFHIKRRGCGTRE